MTKVLIGALLLATVGLGANFLLLDGLFGTVVGPFVADTVYSTSYSGRGFREVREGMSQDEVEVLLGEPLEEQWRYSRITEHGGASEFAVAFDESGKVIRVFARPDVAVVVGLTRTQVIELLGEPLWRDWNYSKPTSDQNYFVRSIRFRDRRVTQRFQGLHLD